MSDSKIPPFYITQTLLGFGPGEPDLNRVFLNLPDETQIVLCEMDEPRTEAQKKRWQGLVIRLNELWGTR